MAFLFFFFSFPIHRFVNHTSKVTTELPNHVPSDLSELFLTENRLILLCIDLIIVN